MRASGKSHLVETFRAELTERATVLRGRCLPYGDGITFWPLIEMARAAAGIVDDDPPERALVKLGAPIDGVAGQDDDHRAARLGHRAVDQRVPGHRDLLGRAEVPRGARDASPGRGHHRGRTQRRGDVPRPARAPARPTPASRRRCWSSPPAASGCSRSGPSGAPAGHDPGLDAAAGAARTPAGSWRCCSADPSTRRSATGSSAPPTATHCSCRSSCRCSWTRA